MTNPAFATGGGYPPNPNDFNGFLIVVGVVLFCLAVLLYLL
jgi:hypothetical protein